MKCSKCQTEYEGNFCPNCGLKSGTTPVNNPASMPNNYNGNMPGYVANNTNYNGNNQPTKPNLPVYKKWWFWVIIVFVVFLFIGIIGSFGSSDDQDTFDTTVITTTEQAIETTAPKTTIKEKKETEPSVPIEYKNALVKAKVYAKNMHMSKQAVYDQLVSEYGEQFPEDAAKYAIDNLKDINWNELALEKAKTYQETMHMSKDAIYDQLVSEYGEKFTKEEAKYAIEHLQ